MRIDINDAITIICLTIVASIFITNVSSCTKEENRLKYSTVGKK